MGNNITNHDLIFAKNEMNQTIYIPEISRYLNTIVLGSKGTGKTMDILPFFVYQDIAKKDAGVTVISNNSDISYLIYAMAKKFKRTVYLIKPSVNNTVKYDFLENNTEEYDYDYINENILNFKEAIKQKAVIIIDMELLRYGDVGLLGLKKLLLQFQSDMQETDTTNKVPHFVYADDSDLYYSYLSQMIQYSTDYNIGFTLFQKNRPNGMDIRNSLLLNNVSISDYHFYKEIYQESFPEKNTEDINLYKMEQHSFFYEIVDNKGKHIMAKAKAKDLLKDITWISTIEELRESAKKYGKRLTSTAKKERGKEIAINNTLVSTTPLQLSVNSSNGEPTSCVDMIVSKLNEVTKEDEKNSTDITEELTREEKKQKQKLLKKFFEKNNGSINTNIEFCEK